MWTVCFAVRCVFFLAHITSQFGMETTCNVDVHSVICTKRLWTIGNFILNVFLTLLPFVFVFFWTKKMLTIQNYIVHDSFDTVVFFFSFFLIISLSTLLFYITGFNLFFNITSFMRCGHDIIHMQTCLQNSYPKTNCWHIEICMSLAA